MYSRILVPTDYSKASFAAFKPAAVLASKFGAEIFLLHVIEEIPLYAYRIGTSQKKLDEQVVERAAAEMRKVAKLLRSRDAELIVRTGNVHKEILSVVKAKRIDLIVMGTHGRTGLAHTVVGSIAEKIVRFAPCQVLTVKPK
jgi:nucleotide-binding universal stress UspA family protein